MKLKFDQRQKRPTNRLVNLNLQSILIFFFGALTLIASGVCNAVSFDCSKAATTVEKLICGSPAVSELDSIYAQKYKAIRKTPGLAENAKELAVYWLRNIRNRCGDTACLVSAYSEIIQKLDLLQERETPQKSEHSAPESEEIPRARFPKADGTIYFNGEVSHSLGSITRSDRYEFAVLETTTRRSVGDEFDRVRASEGGIYVVVKWSTKNVSKRPLGVFDRADHNLVDENGVEYSEDIDASSTYAIELESDEKILSDLNPGIKTYQYSVFEISEAAWNEGAWAFKISDDSTFYYSLK